MQFKLLDANVDGDFVELLWASGVGREDFLPAGASSRICVSKDQANVERDNNRQRFQVPFS
eukprot:5956344-Pleurochrysis_carterae.AAC.1